VADKQQRSFVGLRDLTDASKLAAKRAEAEQSRSMLKRDWALNRAYYAGNQWCVYSFLTDTVTPINADSGPKWRVRLQFNEVKPGLNHYVAQLTKTRPMIDAEPDSGADKDVKSAQMAASLYEYLFDTLNLNAKVQEALMEAGLSGGYWRISWDGLAGKPMTFTVDPNGQPIMDDELAQVYIEELAAQGVPEDYAKKTVYLGDIRVDVLPAENVLVDPTAKRFEEANWVICTHTMDPDEIAARWGVQLQPDSSPAEDNPLPIGTRKERQTDPTTRRVYIMYIRPCPALPDGRYVAWVEGPNRILQDVKWPYPFTELPFVKFPGIYAPESVYDHSIVTDVRPMQDELNKGASQVVEYRNLTVRPQMLAPVGSLRTKLTGEPGAAIEYNPVANQVPQWRDIPNLPPYVFEALAEVQNRIDKTFNRLPSTRDQLPARADSGELMSQMYEAVADQMSPVILRLEDALARAGHIMAAFAQKYYVEPRLLKIRGAGGSVQVKKFMASDIAGGFTFRPRYGTGLPKSREGRRLAIMQMLEAGLIDQRTAMKHLDVGDLKGVQAKLARSEDFAFRTLDKMRRGQPINESAIQQVQQALQDFQQQAMQIMQAVQSGQEVDVNGDGQPESPDQITQILQEQWQQLQQAYQDAPWQPLPYEDKATSLETLGDFMLTVEYENYPPDMKAIFERRFTLLMQAIQTEQQPDPATLPKVSLTAKSTVSAPVMAKILQAQGIDVSEDEVAEEPLETAVYDSVDKPDVDDAGNDPLTQEEHDLAMQQAQDDHLTKQAQAAAQMGNVAANEGRAEERHAQAMRHAEQAHQAKLAQAEQQHQERIRQARQPKPAAKSS
jgi:hypothetical protein